MKTLHLGLFADTILFFSGFLMLVDIAPRDWLPSTKRQREAIKVLHENKNLLLPPPQGVNIQPESTGMGIKVDETPVKELLELIRARSALAGDVEWSRAMGVGFSTLSLPVGSYKLVAFHPLYVVLMPNGEGNQTLILIPVGHFDDLEKWLSTWHQSSLTILAATLLVLGFFIQLLCRFLDIKASNKSPSDHPVIPAIDRNLRAGDFGEQR